MKEYKVHSSWTLYQIPCKDFLPLSLTSNRDIIGRGYTSCGKTGYFIYNVRGDLLKHFKDLYCQLPKREPIIVYTESLLPLPSDTKDKDNKEKMNMKKEIPLTSSFLFIKDPAEAHYCSDLNEIFHDDTMIKVTFLDFIFPMKNKKEKNMDQSRES
ncbi:hypothetical protein Ahy_Scaffold8g108518 [Arachis hypogaea]|uniref:Uncharacterized protein n=1 Tax=Arachis hypogaea TaxID=3818 RepID=A0A444WNY8_ARAHY|nr:hypothetical protein Ahy_Scaffold8g108518 [Arachis hypogaea]